MYLSMWSQPDILFGHFDALRRELNSVFGPASATSSIRSVGSGTFPAINVGRTAQSIEVFAFAPGLDASKIEVTLDRGVLRISGERASSPADADPPVQSYSRERGSGRFARTVSLPEDIDPAQVDASYKDGLLRISVARRSRPQPQRIAVH